MNVIEPSAEPWTIARQITDSETSLRPKTFSEYPGQDRVCDNLKVYTQAAKLRGKMLDHCLFHGPPGLGKTTLAGIVAHEMGCTFKVTSGPVIERVADLMGILASLEPNSILFIDEIHRIPASVEEVLYVAMEDRKMDVVIGQGPSARSVQLDLPAFTLIGATTKPGAMSAPLRDRFGITEHLDYYEPQVLAQIVTQNALKLNMPIQPEAALELGKRSRGTPRVANALLRRVMDFALVAGATTVDLESVQRALQRLGIDALGLAKLDREILLLIRDRYEGGPVGVEAVVSGLNQERSTIEDVCEPYLVYSGLLSRTARGRMLTQMAREHLALEFHP